MSNDATKSNLKKAISVVHKNLLKKTDLVSLKSNVENLRKAMLFRLLILVI